MSSFLTKEQTLIFDMYLWSYHTVYGKQMML